MTVTRFDPAGELIVVNGWVLGPNGRKALVRFVVDTGATMTTVSPDVLDEIGYSARQGETTASVRSPVGSEQGYLIRLARVHVLGEEFSDLRVHALAISDGDEIHGLLGLDVLRQFNCDLRFGEGHIVLDRLP